MGRATARLVIGWLCPSGCAAAALLVCASPSVLRVRLYRGRRLYFHPEKMLDDNEDDEDERTPH